MNKPIKRMEIIKNTIELEDDEIVASQLSHLKKEGQEEGLSSIIQALEQKGYASR